MIHDRPNPRRPGHGGKVGYTPGQKPGHKPEKQNKEKENKGTPPNKP